MAQTKLSTDSYFTYDGLYPSVFRNIDSSNVNTNTFQVNKAWTILSGSATSSALPLRAVYTTILPFLDTTLTINDAANIDDSLQTVTYFSINHLFYKYKNQPALTFGPTNITQTKKFLYQSASILSIPQYKIGEGIKPTSFSFTSSVSGSFASDRYGNIYDTSYVTASIVDQVKFHEGFNEYFDESRITYDSANVTYVQEFLLQQDNNVL
jgi:hypothetical protein